MKKKILCLAALLLAFFALCIPAFAETGYGAIYDATECLGSDALRELGENTMPTISQALGVDLRVDVLTVKNFDTVQEAAAYIYKYYGYGIGNDRQGVSLTIQMQPTADGYAMDPGNWCIHVGGAESLVNGPLQETLTAAVEPYMADYAWNGDDLTMSATALQQATEMMVSEVIAYFGDMQTGIDGGMEADTDSWTEAEPTDAPIEATMNYVLDFAELLGYDEWHTLENYASAISAQYGCGVYVVTVEDYTAYGPDIETVVESTYHQLELGEGRESDGVLLMLSISDRDFATFAYGQQGEYAFSSYALKQMEQYFLDDFAENDWCGGFSDYLDTCREYLALAENGKPVRANPWPNVALMVLLALAIALGICLILKQKMKSVSKKVEANAYVTAGKLKLTQQQDLYTHSIENRTEIKSGNSGSTGSSSGSFSGSSGGHGRSGKF